MSRDLSVFAFLQSGRIRGTPSGVGLFLPDNKEESHEDLAFSRLTYAPIPFTIGGTRGTYGVPYVLYEN
jgi:hypothetical protein